MKRSTVLVPIALGAVIINTMPIWLAELASAPQVSETLAGWLGSSVLLATALACAFPLSFPNPNVARIVVPLAFALLAVKANTAPVLLAATCVILGIALGVLTRQALRQVSSKSDILQSVSAALAYGLGVSFLTYLALSVLPLQVLWVLSALSLVLMIVRPGQESESTKTFSKTNLSALPFRYLPFFALMGAYWSFIEIFAQSLGDHSSVANWLLFSLVAGTVASAVAGKLSARLWQRVSTMALVAASLAGAGSYVATTPLLLGLSIIANGFFLFLFFPLYLASQENRAPQAMAFYLLGFSFGGLIGAVLIEAGGYGTLALVILLSPLPVFVTWQSQPIS